MDLPELFEGVEGADEGAFSLEPACPIITTTSRRACTRRSPPRRDKTLGYRFLNAASPSIIQAPSPLMLALS